MEPYTDGNPWIEQQSSSTEASIPEHARILEKCPDCEETLGTLWCKRCDTALCDECWSDRKPHQRQLPGHNRLQLEAVLAEGSFESYQQLEKALKPKWSTADRKHQHITDYNTIWFGIPRSVDKKLGFEMNMRFDELMKQHHQSHPQVFAVHPRMVSFVGGTGVGKSTLIRILIEQTWNSTTKKDGVNRPTYIPVPVVGDDTTIPTSSDVHLYGDPIGDLTKPKFPLFFADCEGFDGAALSAAAKIVDEAQGSTTTEEPGTRISGRRRFNPLHWSQLVNGSREDALEKLFPRILYNISDVVVYVIGEAERKTIGKVLQRLVEWSKISGTAAVNRVSLPTLIVILNQSDPSGKNWDPDETTSRILNENRDLVVTNTKLAAYKTELEKQGLEIGSIESMLKCSYTSVKFICIPRGDDLALLATQTKILRKMIEDAATKVHDAKEAANMLLTSEYQATFYQMAFEHFSKYIDEPFDFVETFFALRPLPVNLANNIADLLRATKKALTTPDQTSSSGDLARDLIRIVIPVIASAIAIDIHHSYNELPGSLIDIIRGMAWRSESDLDVRHFSYEKQIETAIKNFLDTSSQCWFSNPNTGERCIKKAVAHQEGHPHQDRAGKPMGYGTAGLFEPSPFYEVFVRSWEAAFEAAVAELDTVGTSRSSQAQTVANLPELWHRRKISLRDIFKLAPNFDIDNLSSCIWCLRNVATELLPCGHWICESCLLQIGESCPDDDRVKLLKQCDCHRDKRIINPPFEFLYTSQCVNQRLLCLDEGGLRGIVELYILGAIQEELGEEIPLQDCFDLVCGSGAGGVIALGLGLGLWRVSEAIEKFKELAPNVFSQGKGWDIFNQYLDAAHYERAKLDLSIEVAFGTDGDLKMTESMRNPRNSGNDPPRVFVTTIVQGRGTTVLSNYQRRRHIDFEQSQPNQKVYKYSCAAKIEEAAKATTSSPFYFEPFRTSSGTEYVSSARMCNPAGAVLLEAQCLWPHALVPHPDVLVSIGSGHQRYSGDAPPISKVRALCDNAERFWRSQFGKLSLENPDRYIRLSPGFTKAPPAADAVRALKTGQLEQSTLDFLEHDKRQPKTGDYDSNKVDRVIRRLVSTIFYFHQTSPIYISRLSGQYVVSGSIRCRYKDTSDITKAFGKRIDMLEAPRFVLNSTESPLWSFDRVSLDRMVSQGIFSAPVSIDVPTTSEVFDIKFIADSVFPESISSCPLSISSLLKKL